MLAKHKKNVKQKKSKIMMQSHFNFSKVKSYPSDDLAGLSDWFDQVERQFPTGEFDDKVRVLVLASPTKLQALAESAVEQYCDEWGTNRHREFRERFGQHADIYDDHTYGGKLFETPLKKRRLGSWMTQKNRSRIIERYAVRFYRLFWAVRG